MIAGVSIAGDGTITASQYSTSALARAGVMNSSNAITTAHKSARSLPEVGSIEKMIVISLSIMGCCFPRPRRIDEEPLAGRARIEHEEGRTLANFFGSSAQERIREEEANTRRIHAEARASFHATLKRLKTSAFDIATELQRMAQERQRKELRLAECQRIVVEADRNVRALRGTLDPSVSKVTDSSVVQALEIWRIESDGLTFHHTVEKTLRVKQNLVEIHLNTFRALDVLQASGDVLREAQAKFPIEDVERLHREADTATQELRDTIGILDRMNATTSLRPSAAAVPIQALSEDERRHLLSLALAPPPPRALPAPPQQQQLTPTAAIPVILST